MACGDLGRFPNVANFMSQSARFLLTVEAAASIVDEMEAGFVRRGRTLRGSAGALVRIGR